MTSTAYRRLLVIAPTPKDSEAIAGYLRQSGQRLRTQWSSSLEDARARFGDQAPDLILCADDALPEEVDNLLQACRKRAPMTPVLVVSDVRDMQRLVRYMRRGARDVVSRHNLDHLGMVIIRELRGFAQARALAQSRFRLQELETRHSALIDEIGEAVAHIRAGRLTHANPALAELLGTSDVHALEGRPLTDLATDTSRDELSRTLSAVLETAQPQRLTLTLKGPDAQAVSLACQLRPAIIEDERGVEMLARTQSASASGVLSDIGSRQALFERLAELGSHGAAGDDDEAGLIALAIDGFDAIQQRLGHALADRLAGELAMRLKQAILAAEDELYVYAPHCLIWLARRNEPGQINTAAEAAANTLAAEVFHLDRHSVPVTTSVAVQPLPEGAFDANAALHALLKRVRELQNHGGNAGAALTAADAAGESSEDAAWEERLQQALRHDRFFLAFQAIASLEGHNTKLFDVFIRLAGPQNREVLPGAFMPAAERRGLMKQIDRWVYRHALELLMRGQQHDQGSCLFVKVSESTLCDASLIKWLTAEFKRTAVPPQQLVFELREAAVLAHLSEAKALSNVLARLGCGVCLDHFGRAAESPSLIRHIRPGFVKLTPALTRTLMDGKRDDARLRQLMETTQAYQTKTIAEQIENASVMALLWQLGVNYVQGNYVQPPEAIRADPGGPPR